MLFCNSQLHKMNIFKVTYRYAFLYSFRLSARLTAFQLDETNEIVLVFQLLKKNLEKSIGSSAFTDVNFQLDDGKMKTHRTMLIARCDMMRAMFCNDFREAHAHTVSEVHWFETVSIQ